ncbi:sugar phosphate isomerase/epimerase family protein [Paenibacillus sp. GYB003]|uniref:sugar phosphate isomerase/epimerase family protein n=1 Tax=Paenibacillus sp. GYB003 TaxID=2994392 RepID=UPI002F96A81A
MPLTNKIGVIAENFRVGVRDGLRKAKEAGAEGVQLFARGELDPAALTPGARSEWRNEIASHGLDVSALCISFGGFGLQEGGANADNIALAKRALELAKELGTDIVTMHIGVIPYDTESAVYADMRRACAELCRFAESMDGHFAIETGPTTAYQLKSFLDTLGGRGVAVNFDPANMVMVTGDDPVRGVHLLKDYIVHTHVKDGVRYLAVDPREVYASLDYTFGEGGKVREMVRAKKVYAETPVGEGHVDFDAYFGALADIGYGGYLTVEHEGGGDPEPSIRQAVEFIQAYR